MTSQDVADFIDETLETFRYEPPEPSGLIGVPWSADRVLAGVAELRESLVVPRQAVVRLDPHEGSGGRDEDLWIVAESPDGYFVFFEPDSKEFGLAVGASGGGFESLNVRGDLVGTYLAR